MSLQIAIGTAIVILLAIPAASAQERQITFTPKNHNLDNNDNFSSDGRFLCYDTREMYGPGIGNSRTVEKVAIDTGEETVLYAPRESVTGDEAAPGAGAASYCPVADKVAFIHGPFIEEVAERGYYAKHNRRGMEVQADGSGRYGWIDVRDVTKTRDTIPGAHRGGTHRHEYTLDGKRIGFTYDDWLLPQYDRTVGYMEPRAEAPAGASHYFAVLVPVVPRGTSKAGEIEMAQGDSWIGRHGLMRAFIGKVRAEDGVAYEQSLFAVNVPADVDITSADSGSATRYPGPPRGVSIRRLTHTYAEGTLRGTLDGDRIAYYAKADDGTRQVFVIPSDGSDQAASPEKRPAQVTHFPDGAGPGLRWHPSGNTVFCTSGNGIAAMCVQPGPRFGKSVFLVPSDDGPVRIALVCAPDGKRLAFNKAVPTNDKRGNRVYNFDESDCVQVFLIDVPDVDNDGIPDAITQK